MKKNMGTIDRIMRTVVALAIVVLYVTGQISGAAALLLGTIALVFIATGIVGTCPIYLPLRLSTRSRNKNAGD